MVQNRNAAATNNSLLSMYIFEILRKHSDKDHPMSESQIREKLENTQDFKFSEVNRKVVPFHTRAIMNYLPGFIVEIKVPVSQNSKKYMCKWYYDGGKAGEHPLFSHSYCTPNEVKFLIDMISSNQLLTSEGSKDFISKLLRSLNEWEEKEILSRLQVNDDYYKNENDTIRSVYDKLIKAKKEENAVDITFESGGHSQDIPSACVYAVYTKEGTQYTYVADNGHFEGEIALPQIKRIKVLSSPANNNDDIEDKLDRLGITDIQSIDAAIETDTLFSNIEQIDRGIIEKRYLNFNDYRSKLLDRTLEAPTRTVIPLKTIFQKGKYYLIAIEKYNNTESSVFVRIDLMENVTVGRKMAEGDIKKADIQNEHSYIHTDPQILAKTKPIPITFYIKKEAIHRALEAFGYSAYAENDISPLETATTVRKKIAESDPEFFSKAFTGFDFNDELIEVSAEAIEEDVIPWALENADAVEITSPEYLRLKLREMTDRLHARYSKKEYDILEEQYRKIISGEESLTYGGNSKNQEHIIARIVEENAYDKVTKISIESRCSSDTEKLKKFKNLQSLLIHGDAIKDFSFLKAYEKLENLILIGTSMIDGSILTELPNLGVLFMHRNKITDYAFLKDLNNLSVLYLGKNNAKDFTPLYDLEKLDELVLEEEILESLEIEKLLFSDNRHCMLQRWIDSDYSYVTLPKRYPINYKFYCNNIKKD